MSCKLIFFALFFNCLNSKTNSISDIWDRLQDDDDLYFAISYPYDSHGVHYTWDLVGSSIILNNKIVLTNDQKSQTGGIWSINPYYGKYWAVELEFKIYSSESLFGDGMAFWYTRDTMKSGTALGNQNLFYGMGVFFDTFNNHQESSLEYPYISTSVDNMTVPYDHSTDGISTALAGCSKNVRNDQTPTRALIIYDKNVLSVYIKNPKSSHYSHVGYEECFSIPGVHLPGGLYFGVTAATGDLTDNHELISLRVLSLDEEDHRFSDDILMDTPRVDNNENLGIDSKAKIKRGFSIALIVICSIGGLIAFMVCMYCGGFSNDRLY